MMPCPIFAPSAICWRPGATVAGAGARLPGSQSSRALRATDSPCSPWRRRRNTCCDHLLRAGRRYEGVDEVRVRNERPAEADEIGEVIGASFKRQLQVIAVVGDVKALEGLAQALRIEGAGRIAVTLRITLDDVEVDEAEAVQLLDQIEIGRAPDCRRPCHRTVVDGRKADANALAAAPDLGYGFRYLDDDAGAVLEGAAVAVGTQVGFVGEELLQQIAVGGMNLDAVEAGVLGELRAACAYSPTMRGISSVSSARGVTSGLKPSLVKACPVGKTALGATGSGAARLKIGMRDAAHVPELQENVPALLVHGVGGEPPGLDVAVRENPRRQDIALGFLADVGGFRNDEPGRSALARSRWPAARRRCLRRRRASGSAVPLTMRLVRVSGPSWTGPNRSVVSAKRAYGHKLIPMAADCEGGTSPGHMWAQLRLQGRGPFIRVAGRSVPLCRDLVIHASDLSCASSIHVAPDRRRDDRTD